MISHHNYPASKAYFRRSIAALIALLFAIALGLWACLKLPIAMVPQRDGPSIYVQADYPGATALAVSGLVAAPLERALAGLEGIESISSSSVAGTSLIQLEFSSDKDSANVLADVQSVIANNLSDLPEDLPRKPRAFRKPPSDSLVLTLALTYGDGSDIEADRVAVQYVAERLKRISGVSAIEYHGRRSPAIVVEVDGRLLRNSAATLLDVKNAIARSAFLPAGVARTATQRLTVGSNDEALTVEGLRAALVNPKADAEYRLGDIAEVRKDVEDKFSYASYNSEAAILIDVIKSSSANTLMLTAAIKDAVAEIRSDLPKDMELQIVGDRTRSLTTSLRESLFTFSIAFILIFLVTLAGLRSVRLGVGAALLIPFSVGCTLFIFLALGLSLNAVTLLALTVVTGFVIDDSIVVAERSAVIRSSAGFHAGYAFEAARQLRPMILAMTISLVVAFAPLTFVKGAVGQIFWEFGIAAASLIIVSGMASVSLTPALIELLDRRSGQGVHATWKPVAELREAYSLILARILGFRKVSFVLAILFAAGSVGLYVKVDKVLLPRQDNNVIVGAMRTEQGMSANESHEEFALAARMMQQVRDVVRVTYWVDGRDADNAARLVIEVKDRADRQATSMQVILRELRAKVSQLPGLIVSVQAKQDLRVATSAAPGAFEYLVWGENRDVVARQAEEIFSKFKVSRSVQDAYLDVDSSSKAVITNLDREKARMAGVSARDVEETLNLLFAGRKVSSVTLESGLMPVFLGVNLETSSEGSGLDGVAVASIDGALIPLSQLVQENLGSLPDSVRRSNGWPSASIYVNTKPEASIEDLIRDASDIRSSDAHSAVFGRFVGVAAEFERSISALPMLVFASIVVIVLVLTFVYGDLLDALVVLGTVPSAVFGGLLALWLTSTPLDMIGGIGLLTLIGIAKKNGVLLVDRASTLVRGGLSARAAALAAARDRFLAILMTTVAAVLGALPLLFVSGPGKELYWSLGVVVVGGLAVSQVFTMFSVPVAYAAYHGSRQEELNWSPKNGRHEVW